MTTSVTAPASASSTSQGSATLTFSSVADQNPTNPSHPTASECCGERSASLRDRHADTLDRPSSPGLRLAITIGSLSDHGSATLR